MKGALVGAIMVVEVLAAASARSADLSVSALWTEQDGGSNAWSPDGRSIVLASGTTGTRADLVSDRIDGSARRVLVRQGVADRIPTLRLTRRQLPAHTRPHRPPGAAAFVLHTMFGAC
jgi:hypothetical protein